MPEIVVGQKVVWSVTPSGKPLALPTDVRRWRLRQRPREPVMVVMVRAGGAVEKWALEETREFVVPAFRMATNQKGGKA